MGKLNRCQLKHNIQAISDANLCIFFLTPIICLVFTDFNSYSYKLLNEKSTLDDIYNMSVILKV